MVCVCCWGDVLMEPFIYPLPSVIIIPQQQQGKDRKIMEKFGQPKLGRIKRKKREKHKRARLGQLVYIATH